ncbi:cytochrome b [Terriglobus roseus]|uniref:Cytochrome b561 n=1 Tax=Terriglobus roseus TaxID=392734 RepID=A0A1H4K6Z1_9BACT|nr:cytochrome b/b6 domain-containing protein [Terriglobus roseus]SEB54290.1 cytochrome b561 [Terriglobus roseus]
MTAIKRFTAPQRLLHWGMAVCIVAMLFLGVGMISTVTPKWLTLVQIHKTLGIIVLLLALLRLLLRIRYTSPSLPRDMPVLMRFAADSSQYVFYALMLSMPLLGWGMLSAAAHPVVLFGKVHLPAIVPVSAALYPLLQRAHSVLGYAFFALILMHTAALLFHKLVRKDGVFEAMAPVVTVNQKRELDAKHV